MNFINSEMSHVRGNVLKIRNDTQMTKDIAQTAETAIQQALNTDRVYTLETSINFGRLPTLHFLGFSSCIFSRSVVGRGHCHGGGRALPPPLEAMRNRLESEEPAALLCEVPTLVQAQSRI